MELSNIPFTKLSSDDISRPWFTPRPKSRPKIRQIVDVLFGIPKGRSNTFFEIACLPARQASVAKFTLSEANVLPRNDIEMDFFNSLIWVHPTGL